MQKKTKRILKTLADEFDISPFEAEIAIKAYYIEMKRLLESGDTRTDEPFKVINIPTFAKFIPRNANIKRIKASRAANPVQGIPDTEPRRDGENDETV